MNKTKNWLLAGFTALLALGAMAQAPTVHSTIPPVKYKELGSLTRSKLSTGFVYLNQAEQNISNNWGSIQSLYSITNGLATTNDLQSLYSMTNNLVTTSDIAGFVSNSDTNNFATTNDVSDLESLIAESRASWNTTANGVEIANIPQTVDGQLGKLSVPSTFGDAVFVDWANDIDMNEIDLSTTGITYSNPVFIDGPIGSRAISWKSFDILSQPSWGTITQEDSFSLEFWYKFNSGNDYGGVNTISLRGYGDNKFLIFDTVQQYLKGNCTSAAMSTTRPPIGTWVHISMNHDAVNNQFRIYADGVLVATSTRTSDFSMNPSTAYNGIFGYSSYMTVAYENLTLRVGSCRSSQFEVPTVETGSVVPSPKLVSAGYGVEDFVLNSETNRFATTNDLAGFITTNDLGGFATTNDLGNLALTNDLDTLRGELTSAISASQIAWDDASNGIQVPFIPGSVDETIPILSVPSAMGNAVLVVPMEDSLLDLVSSQLPLAVGTSAQYADAVFSRGFNDVNGFDARFVFKYDGSWGTVDETRDFALSFWAYTSNQSIGTYAKAISIYDNAGNIVVELGFSYYNNKAVLKTNGGTSAAVDIVRDTWGHYRIAYDSQLSQVGVFYKGNRIITATVTQPFTIDGTTPTNEVSNSIHSDTSKIIYDDLVFEVADDLAFGTTYPIPTEAYGSSAPLPKIASSGKSVADLETQIADHRASWNSSISGVEIANVPNLYDGDIVAFSSQTAFGSAVVFAEFENSVLNTIDAAASPAPIEGANGVAYGAGGVFGSGYYLSGNSSSANAHGVTYPTTANWGTITEVDDIVVEWWESPQTSTYPSVMILTTDSGDILFERSYTTPGALLSGLGTSPSQASSTAMTAGVWQHMLVSYEGATQTIRMFQDGIKTAEINIGGATFTISSGASANLMLFGMQSGTKLDNLVLRTGTPVTANFTPPTTAYGSETPAAKLVSTGKSISDLEDQIQAVDAFAKHFIITGTDLKFINSVGATGTVTIVY